MMIKYRVHEVAKDFDIPSKNIVAILKDHFGVEKKSQTALEENELNVIFDAVTLERQVESFDAYFAAGEEARKARKEQAEKEKADRAAEQARIAAEFLAAAKAAQAAEKTEDKPAKADAKPAAEAPKAKGARRTAKKADDTTKE